MSTATEEFPEPDSILVQMPDSEPVKIEPPTGVPEIATPLGVLDARLQVLDFLIQKELDDLSMHKRQQRRCQDRLHQLGRERTAIKRVAKAFNDEADPTTDERTAA